MRRRIFQALGALTFVLLAIGIVLPFLRADRYRDPLQSAISRALGRQVSVGAVHLDLFNGPGFTARDVQIGDDPAISAEPFAYIGELHAVPRLLSLWSGKLQFSSLTLDDTHLNLARLELPNKPPAWNFDPLLRPGLLAAFPSIRIRSSTAAASRVNFKFNGRKSSFYLLNADLEISPRNPDGSQWQLRFKGEPARNDRPARGFGVIEARGSWKLPAAGEEHVELDLRLGRSEIGDLVALTRGADAGVHGYIAGQVHVAGAPTLLGLEGEVRVSELHGWDESLPSGGTLPFRVSGTANAVTQEVELFATARDRNPDLTVHLSGQHYLRNPDWRGEIRADELPVNSLPGLFRNFGLALPEGLRIAGVLQGALRYDPVRSWSGEARIHDIAIAARNTSPLLLNQADWTLNSDTIELHPTAVRSGEEAIGSVAGRYGFNDGSVNFSVTNPTPLPATLLQRFPLPAIPLLSTLQTGNWQGDLHFSQSPGSPGRWVGAGTLTGATLSLNPFVRPLGVKSARVNIDGDGLKVDHAQLSIGDVVAEADYRYVPLALRPHQFHATVESIDLADLEDLLQPVLRRKTNLLDMALSFGTTPTPSWLRSMGADGLLQADILRINGTDLSNFRTRVQWNGTNILLSDVKASMSDATLSGKGAIDVRDLAPRYSLDARVNGLAWQNGELDAQLQAHTSGHGHQILTNLDLSASINGQDIQLDPFGSVENLTADAEVINEFPAPRFEFPTIRLVSDGQTWTGSGRSDESGEVVLQLFSEGRQIQLAGSLTDPNRNWVER